METQGQANRQLANPFAEKPCAPPRTSRTAFRDPPTPPICRSVRRRAEGQAGPTNLHHLTFENKGVQSTGNHQPTDRRFFSSDFRTFPARVGQLLHVHAFAVRAPTLAAEVRSITRLIAHLGEFGRFELLIAPDARLEREV
jgi:hypothetical protein